ncbi:hypothetical protein BTA51_24190 [Hahella sp. CCB-MM4]|uniref:GIY-YIG nuclease family protein n=1 Tax=Hahella sp. (strain CCB-MM4) TaxID=1926491 RepID=UPI000B9BF5EF|nr:GIY-YIG nuclease family protein [Hahella sp. CCB-MM4]OZG70697.1 hypothetical protein BTA51_24190 [Hahella sp. CCB-MM4]
MKKKGFLYILANSTFSEGVYKIGKTTRRPEIRAWELYEKSSGIPEPFDIVHQRLVKDCHEAERLIHERLKEYRINEYREFFKLSLVEAKAKVNQVVYFINENLEYNEKIASNEKVTIICRQCRKKNKLPKYALQLSLKCGNCKRKLVV